MTTQADGTGAEAGALIRQERQEFGASSLFLRRSSHRTGHTDSRPSCSDPGGGGWNNG